MSGEHVKMRNSDYRVMTFPKLRRALALMYPAVQRTHKIHGLIEVDVTEARHCLREHEARTGERLSFTAFVIACLARAVAENPSLNAVHKGGRRLALFDDVDVAMLIERDVEGRKQPSVYSVRRADKKPFHAIHREIRAAQSAAIESIWEGLAAERWLTLLPMAVLRVLWATFWWARGRFPEVQRRYGGTVGLTAVGMFGAGGGWGIPLSYHTLDVTLGGVAEKPGVVEGRIAIREYLCVTLSFDHDVIDGAPAARFVSRLRELIESGYGLSESRKDQIAGGVPGGR